MIKGIIDGAVMPLRIKHNIVAYYDFYWKKMTK